MQKLSDVENLSYMELFQHLLKTARKFCDHGETYKQDFKVCYEELMKRYEDRKLLDKAIEVLALYPDDYLDNALYN